LGKQPPELHRIAVTATMVDFDGPIQSH